MMITHPPFQPGAHSAPPDRPAGIPPVAVPSVPLPVPSPVPSVPSRGSGPAKSVAFLVAVAGAFGTGVHVGSTTPEPTSQPPPVVRNIPVQAPPPVVVQVPPEPAHIDLPMLARLVAPLVRQQIAEETPPEPEPEPVKVVATPARRPGPAPPAAPITRWTIGPF